MTMKPVCWLARRRLGAYRDGELGPGTRVRLEAHLEGCEGCLGEVERLDRLRAALRAPLRAVPEVPAAAWEAFWPQVRTRIAASATPAAAPGPAWRRAWASLAGHPRLTLGSALATAALAILAVVAPWQQAPLTPSIPSPGPVQGVGVGLPPGPATPVGAGGGAAPAWVAGGGPGEVAVSQAQVVVHSVETADPQSSVMIFASPDSDLTVVWVFGLERTES
jgi:hypothetical protein